jgi:hypothetical protein
MLQPSQASEKSLAFDNWLCDTAKLPASERNAALTQWSSAPAGRFCHPREGKTCAYVAYSLSHRVRCATEHLIPVHVVSGAADDNDDAETWSDVTMGSRVSAVIYTPKVAVQ